MMLLLLLLLLLFLLLPINQGWCLLGCYIFVAYLL